MKRLKISVGIASLMVLLICVYSFLGGNEVFKGNFSNDYISWYFLAKGIFCSVALCLLAQVVEKMCEKK